LGRREKMAPKYKYQSIYNVQLIITSGKHKIIDTVKDNSNDNGNSPICRIVYEYRMSDILTVCDRAYYYLTQKYFLLF